MLRRVPWLIRPLINSNNGIFSTPVMGYKSQYSIDKLYPESNPDFLKTSVPEAPKAPGPDGNFSGYIPIDALDIRYSRSGGPGGQHVNKVNTKVEIRFHVPSAEWLSEKTRGELMKREKGRITKDSYLILTSEKTRKQMLNQADCLERLRHMIRSAETKPYEPSEDDLQLIRERKEAARKSILREKRHKSLKKQSRAPPTSL